MGRPHIAVEEREQAFGLDELHTIIGAEMPALIVPPVEIAFRVALLRIEDEGFLVGGEFAVGTKVDTLVVHQPEAGPSLVGG